MVLFSAVLSGFDEPVFLTRDSGAGVVLTTTSFVRTLRPAVGGGVVGRLAVGLTICGGGVCEPTGRDCDVVTTRLLSWASVSVADNPNADIQTAPAHRYFLKFINTFCSNFYF